MITAIEDAGEAANFANNQPTELSQLYGEAVTMHANRYRKLIRYYGDVPFSESEGLVSCHAVYEHILADLIKAEPLMYRLGENGMDKSKFSRTFFKKVLDNPGTATLHLTDPRQPDANGKRVYDNPYQYFFQQMHQDCVQGSEHYADESIYEIVQTYGSGNDSHPYSFGRPAAGGNSRKVNNGYPCKNYG